MTELMLRNLLGEQDFTTFLLGLDDRYFSLHRGTQQAIMKAVLSQFNSGINEIGKLISFAREWMNNYDECQV